MKKGLVNALKFIIFLGTGVGILYLVYRSQDKAYAAECALRGVPAEDCSLFSKVINDFANANYAWLLVVLLCFTLSNISRAVRWNMLLQQLGQRPRFANSFLSIILGYFANLGLPRLGEVVRAGTLARYERIPIEKVIGTVVVDRIVDVISILAVTALGLLLAFERIWSWVAVNVNLGERFAGVGTLLLVLGALGLGVLAVLWTFRRRLRSTALYGKVAGIGRGFSEGLRTVGKLRHPWWFVFHSVNIWFMYFCMTYFCFFAFAPTAGLSPVAALVTFVFGGWGVVIPSPGGMGTYHFLAQVALGLYGIPGDDAFSWANISFFSIQLGCNVSVGILALIFLPIINRDYHPAPPPQPAPAMSNPLP